MSHNIGFMADRPMNNKEKWLWWWPTEKAGAESFP